ncbi:MAG: RagB/SusD family nutrient uptake outer membrane protein, partial [Balneolales bacterium]
MKTIKKIPFLIALCVVLTSCDNNFLSPEPRSFFTPENTFVDPQGYESLLVTMRKSFAREATGNRHYLSSEFVSSDLAVAVFQMDFFKNTPSNSQFFPYLRMFDDIYSFLKNSNVIVSRIDDIEWPDTEVRDAILAEAYWHRAYWYYRLVHSYGDVPWIGEELHGAKLDFETYSRWAILDKIQEDLEWAAERLHDSANPGVPTKAAANHLLA